ncbi:type III polyketide synthase [Bacillus sp. FJAT-44742]|uniref:type III polyketide synthase n=1 Tax=Bacillus sp. FJAT-44742 TaxID=2014005 RepID=UPI000C23A885|nr:3-oxoacyl-[acyl-carrier-protein] synthase III C-terminal domain-containing protein [Bacillus sp. FJAT-44742]
MPVIRSVSTVDLPCQVSQQDTMRVVREMFKDHFYDIDRLLTVFGNGQIENRNLVKPLEWFTGDHSFQERNDIYIKEAVSLGSKAVACCLKENDLTANQIDAIIYVSSSGLATPSIEARIMNMLKFSAHTKRIPLWGLGCAGGAAGISRAHEYCLAYPGARVLVLCVELCSLTFQREDTTKSNLIGTSLFSDGVACALIEGDQIETNEKKEKAYPNTKAVQSTLMRDSEDVMGWDVKDNGLNVIFSRDIPSIIESWLKPNVEEFLLTISKTIEEISYFVAHPGGKKVLTAYEKAMSFTEAKTEDSRKVLAHYGNMSSPTVLYVLKETMNKQPVAGEEGLLTALGPGFSSELVWLEWK